MLKFVTTKPPRGRSSSGSGTPDRDISHRPSSHETSPTKGHYSPRFIRKHYSSSQHQTYPESRSHFGSASSSPSSYRPLPSSSRGYFVTSGDVTRRRGETAKGRYSPVDSRSAKKNQEQYYTSDQPYQRAPTLYEQQQQQYRQEQQQQQQQQQQQYSYQVQQEQPLPQQQPPWSVYNTKYAYKQATPNESSGQYATLHFREPRADTYTLSSREKRFPLEVEGLYNLQGDPLHHSARPQTAPKPQTAPTPQTAPKPTPAPKPHPSPKPQRGTETPTFNQFPASTTEVARPEKGPQTYRGAKNIPHGYQVTELTVSPVYPLTPDYDVAKEIPTLNDPYVAQKITDHIRGPSIAKKINRPVTTQYIINETITKKKTTHHHPPFGEDEKSPPFPVPFPKEEPTPTPGLKEITYTTETVPDTQSTPAYSPPISKRKLEYTQSAQNKQEFSQSSHDQTDFLQASHVPETRTEKQQVGHARAS